MNKGAATVLVLAAMAAAGVGGVELSKRMNLPEEKKAQEIAAQYKLEQDKQLKQREGAIRNSMEQRFNLRKHLLETNYKKLRGELRRKAKAEIQKLEQKLKSQQQSCQAEIGNLKRDLKQTTETLTKRAKEAEQREAQTRKNFYGSIDELFRLPAATTLTDLEQTTLIGSVTGKESLDVSAVLSSNSNVLYDKQTGNTRVVAKKHKNGSDDYMLLFKMDSKGNIRALYMFESSSYNQEQYMEKLTPYKTVMFTGDNRVLLVDHKGKTCQKYSKATLKYDGTAGFKTYNEHALKTLALFRQAYTRGTEDAQAPEPAKQKPVKPKKKTPERPYESLHRANSRPDLVR